MVFYFSILLSCFLAIVMVNKGEYNNVFLTRLVVMLTVWPDFETGRSVVVELTAIWLIRYVVEMFASTIISARHSAAYNSRSFRHCWGHFGTQCRIIRRTQSCSVGRTCHQFHSLPLSFNSRQRHYHQPRNYRQNVYWRHCFVLLRRRQHKDYLPQWGCALRDLGVVDEQLKLRSSLCVRLLLPSDRVTTDNTVSDTDRDDGWDWQPGGHLFVNNKTVCSCTRHVSPTKCFYLCASHGGKADIVSAPFVHVSVCARMRPRESEISTD